MEKPVLSARGIQKHFYQEAKLEVLKDVSLEVGKSETIAIVGVSGCGKSTLLYILATLEKPTSGTLELLGIPIEKHCESYIRNHLMGFIFQSGNLLEEYSLLDNLLIKAKIARKAVHKQSESYQKAISLLEKVGLSSRMNFLVKYLSGGEKQRAAIARALMNDPEIILADEPTGNLDVQSAKNIQELLINCCKEFQKSLIVVTHDTEFANLCDRTLKLHVGKLYDANTPSMATS